jgi:hypothetical protein
LRSINAWQLDHPTSSKQECEEWVKGKWEGEGRAEWEAAVPPPPEKKQKLAAAEKRKR